MSALAALALLADRSDAAVPPVVRVERGCFATAGADVARVGRQVFICASPGAWRRGTVARLADGLAEHGVAVVGSVAVAAEPDCAEVDAVVAAVPAAADVVVGLGGGSAMDAAKLAAALAGRGRSVAAYYGEGLVRAAGRPAVMIPSLAGSGSEVTYEAVVTNRTRGTKFAFKDRTLLPVAALVDPDLTASCGPSLTAMSGVDALTHAVEAVTGRRATSATVRWGLAAIGVLGTALPAVLRDPGDAETRLTTSLGATLAGLAFATSGTGVVHACGYPVSGRFGVPHGVANGILLPFVVEQNASRGASYEAVAAALGAPDLVAWLAAFVAGLGLPARLGAVGVTRADVPMLAAVAATDTRHLAANAVDLDEADLRRIFLAAL